MFSNPITGGQGILVRPAIKSPNFVPGVSGWIITKTGHAEFNDIDIRGGSVIQGQVFVYNGTPTLGNLVLSISPTAGTDPFGNQYVAGEGLYTAAGTITARDPAGNIARLSARTATSGLLANLPAATFQPVTNPSGDPAIVGALDQGVGTDLALLLTSPSPVTGGLPGTDYAQILMTGRFPNPTNISLSAAAVLFNSLTSINANGVIDTYAGDIFTSYTPTITGGGSATFTTRNGRFVKIGRMVFFGAYIIVGTAGSGALNVTITAPSNIDRTLRQFVPISCEGMSAGNGGSCGLVAFTTGSGNAFDRLRSSTGGNITGADLLAGAILAATGWYREA